MGVPANEVRADPSGRPKWSDGRAPWSGLLEICAVGYAKGSYDLDTAINSAAQDELNEAGRREMVLNLLALAREFGWIDGTAMNQYREPFLQGGPDS